jgi:hypothetical protein
LVNRSGFRTILAKSIISTTKLLLLVPIYLTIAILLVSGPLASVKILSEDLQPAKEYTAFWDRRDAEIREAEKTGIADVTIPKLPIDLGFEIIEANSDHWVNRCAASYYGVDTLEAR